MSPPPIRWKLPLAGALLGIGGWATYRLLALRPAWAEAVAGSGPLPALRRALSLATGALPFPLAELFVAVALAWIGAGVARSVRHGRGRPSGQGALRIVVPLAGRVGVLVFLFYLLWGVLYARPGVEERLGVESAGEVPAAELAQLTGLAVRATNEAYLELHGVPDLGEPTPAVPPSELREALEEGWAAAVRRWALPERMALPHGAPKRFLFSEVVKRFGVAGMHFPFTGEALHLADLPGVTRATTMAHEMAHQRGVASESDANVLAFLVAREAPHPGARYAAYSFLHRQWINALWRVDPEAAAALAAGRLPGVQRDIRALDEYWEPGRGRAAAVGTGLNHAMLRSHGIPEGVASYRGSTWVFAALAREHGVDAILPAPGDGGATSIPAEDEPRSAPPS